MGPRASRSNRAWTAGLLAAALACAACHGGDDLAWRSRKRVRRLAEARGPAVSGALDAVVALGRVALPDIEQEFHAVPLASRLQFVEALRRIGDPEAVPFLSYVARHGRQPLLRRRAAAAARAIARRASGPPGSPAR